jgi:hypothetical protein
MLHTTTGGNVERRTALLFVLAVFFFCLGATPTASAATFAYLVTMGDKCQPRNPAISGCVACYDIEFIPDSTVYIDCTEGSELESKVECGSFHPCCPWNHGELQTESAAEHERFGTVRSTAGQLSSECAELLDMDLTQIDVVVTALATFPHIFRYNKSEKVLQLVNCRGKVVAQRRPVSVVLLALQKL